MSKQSVLDKYAEKEIRVLDKGWVRLVDVMGEDESIVQAARVSYGKGTKKVSEDRGLIRYLMKHQHSSPLEMCEIKLHIKLPIFVARQIVRHRTASISEYSGRYSEMPDEFYEPDLLDITGQNQKNRQSRGTELSESVRTAGLGVLVAANQDSYSRYQSLLNYGVARELSRVALPLSAYTQWYWKIDLHNLLHFLNLRLSSHAQLEVRVYAEAITEIVKEWVPFVWEAFEDYKLYAKTFSRQEVTMLHNIVTAYRSKNSQDEFNRWLEDGAGFTKKEAEEFLGKLE